MKYHKSPNVWSLRGLVDHCVSGGVSCQISDGRWVPARPLGFDSLQSRVKAAWLVFTGKADAVIWPEQ